MIVALRKLAGAIGEIRDPYPFPTKADAENYDFQVQLGLAAAAVGILDGNVEV